MRYCLLFFCFAYINTITVFSQEWYESKVIIVKSWAEVEKQSAIGNSIDSIQNPYVRFISKNIEEDVHTLAVNFLTGLVYGYNFLYIPSDASREISETWELTPIAEIQKNDNNLIMMRRDVLNNALYKIYRYNLIAGQVEWLRSWEDISLLPSAGEGLVLFNENNTLNDKIAAMHDAIRSAVRKKLRERIRSKPYKITGLVKLTEQPFITQNGAYYLAKVMVRINVKDIQEYKVF